MQRFIIYILFLILIPDAYIYWGYLKKRVRAKFWRRIFWLPSVLMIALFLMVRYIGTGNAMSERAELIEILGVLILLFGVTKLLFMLIGLVGDLLRWLLPIVPHSFFTRLGTCIAVSAFCIILYGSFFGTTRFEVKQVSYSNPRLPKGFEGFKVVHISDIHAGSWAANTAAIEKLVTTINQLSPDLILFTGDLINHHAHEIDALKPFLSKLEAPYGVYSVLGNHDYGDYFRWKNDSLKNADHQYLLRSVAEMGWKMLNNDHDIIRRNGDSIAIVGTENDGNPPFQHLGNLSKATEGIDGIFKILMTHDPTYWKRTVLKQSDIELTLSGHTHGAQFSLFCLTPAALAYREWGGLYTEGSRALYINVGIGYVGLPFRFGAWPEITLFTLHE